MSRTKHLARAKRKTPSTHRGEEDWQPEGSTTTPDTTPPGWRGPATTTTTTLTTTTSLLSPVGHSHNAPDRIASKFFNALRKLTTTPKAIDWTALPPQLWLVAFGYLPLRTLITLNQTGEHMHELLEPTLRRRKWIMEHLPNLPLVRGGRRVPRIAVVRRRA
jgi:hypothetical protein